MQVYRFEFQHRVSMSAVEDVLLLSVMAVSSLRGDAALLLDSGYQFNSERRIAVIDATTQTGRELSQVFVGLCGHEFGLESFTVERAEPSTAVAG